MVTLSILMILALIAIIVIGIILLVTGALTLTVFGDLIICVAIIALIVKLIRRKKK